MHLALEQMFHPRLWLLWVFPAFPKYLNLSSQTHTQMRSGQSTPRRPHSAPPRRASPQALQWDGIMTIHDRHSEHLQELSGWRNSEELLSFGSLRPCQAAMKLQKQEQLPGKQGTRARAWIFRFFRSRSISTKGLVQ